LHHIAEMSTAGRLLTLCQNFTLIGFAILRYCEYYVTALWRRLLLEACMISLGDP